MRQLAILSALAVAEESVKIMTPYFLPPPAITAALNVAAMRGVDVKIVLPGLNNIKIVRWASRAGYDELLEKGCQIFESAPPFDHSGRLLESLCRCAVSRRLGSRRTQFDHSWLPKHRPLPHSHPS